jgi:hypothetical protein
MVDRNRKVPLPMPYYPDSNLMIFTWEGAFVYNVLNNFSRGSALAPY